MVKGEAVPGFQSLSGFPMSCNAGSPDGPPEQALVSIPIGFSNELQRIPIAG